MTPRRHCSKCGVELDTPFARPGIADVCELCDDDISPDPPRELTDEEKRALQIFAVGIAELPIYTLAIGRDGKRHRVLFDDPKRPPTKQ